MRKVEERKEEALWHFIEARLEEVLEKTGLPLEALPALEAGYLAALEDFAPVLYEALKKKLSRRARPLSRENTFARFFPSFSGGSGLQVRL